MKKSTIAALLVIGIPIAIVWIAYARNQKFRKQADNQSI
jgi:hypothetical protein